MPKKNKDSAVLLKQHALEIAHRTHQGKSDDEIISAAKKYFGFLKGDK